MSKTQKIIAIRVFVCGKTHVDFHKTLFLCLYIYILKILSLTRWEYIKQLLNEVEHDIENYQGRGLCCQPKPKAEVDNTNRGLDNSRYYAKTEFNNCFIMYSKHKKQHKKNR